MTTYRVAIYFDDDQRDLAHIVYGELGWRFRDLVVDIDELTDDESDLTDDEIAADVAEINQRAWASVDEALRRIAREAASPQAAIAAMSDLRSEFGHSNAAMHRIDDAISAMERVMLADRGIRLDVVAGADPAPPHGIERPLLPRPNATTKHGRNTPQRLEAVAFIRDHTTCPTCGATPGHWCGSANSIYGSGHMHEARIDVVYGARS